jgi:hypothetical protein
MSGIHKHIAPDNILYLVLWTDLESRVHTAALNIVTDKDNQH